MRNVQENHYMKKDSKDNSKLEPLDAAPGDIAADTGRKFFEASAMPRVERNRMWALLVLSLGLNVVQGIGTYSLFPLKTVETILVNKSDNGRLTSDGEPIGKWIPDRDMISYFLSEWTRSVFVINAATLDATNKRAAEMATGIASQQLRDLRSKENPFVLLQEAPGMVRTVDIISVNYLSDTAALVRYRTTTLRAGTAARVETFALSIVFTKVKPTTREEAARNPAGLYITNFSRDEESISK
jgi:type IV secretory pathway component VirB8